MCAKKKIVIVENDPDMLFLLEILLKECGYAVAGMKTGHAILETEYTWPDLFILDKDLPGIDGLALSKFLKVQREIMYRPIIMISAYPVRNKAMLAGVDAFFEKPFAIDDLLLAVHSYLSQNHVKKFSLQQ